jgi:membrane fusion protein (multidrug efflux system)
MANHDEKRSPGSMGAGALAPDAVPGEVKGGSTAAPAEGVAHHDRDAVPSGRSASAGTLTGPAAAGRSSHPFRKWLVRAIMVAALAAGAYYLIPAVNTALNTISTDDAYVNGHVTFVAPRVTGYVMAVFVDDNYRVKKGQMLVQLDQEPYQVQVAIKRAAVAAAETDLAAAQAQARGLAATMRANRYQLERAMEDVRTQLANLKANVATLESRKATLKLAQQNLKRGEDLKESGGISKEDLDTRRQQVAVDQAAVEQALQAVHATRAGLGLPIEPEPGHNLSEAEPELDQNFSAVREALGQLVQSAALLGFSPKSKEGHEVWELTPDQAKEIFLSQDPARNVDRIYNKIIPQAPAIKQAEAKLEQANRDLALADLNLSYCEIRSEIDGVVTRRNVNPGNNVQVGQALMAVRSLTEIWIDANFKETQLAELRIGQRVRCEVDMYGSRHDFEGRITGFTMGTGQTLALLPPQNATGNFVKIVQRLPVRIELTDYDPDTNPLFVGLSVVPYVYYKERPTGKNAGQVLQPLAPPTQSSTTAGTP